MSKRRGLGRGLDVFFPSGAREQAAASGAADTVERIPVERISANPKQPRRRFEEARLQELADSIRANGVLAPIVVRRKADAKSSYEIVAGERRWRAAKLAGLSAIPALVRDVEDAAAIELALVENLQRTDLNAIEEAAGYRQLIEEHGFTQDELARRVGKSRPAVANALRLLSLPDAVQALLRDGRLSSGHARALVGMPVARAEHLARQAADGRLNVRDIERAAAQTPPARGARPAPSQHKTAASLSPELAEVENRLRFALATQVCLRRGAGGGSIEIRFANDGELQRIVDAICPERE
jgi:ParB family chromosome partitioning protein